MPPPQRDRAALAADLGVDGIRVNAIMPGIFGTPMLRGLPAEVQDSLAAEVTNPKRLGDPKEYARLAAFRPAPGQSISSRSSGIAAAISRSSALFLNVTIPDSEI